jgi:nucleoside-diphosphate-sugar epimerase
MQWIQPEIATGAYSKVVTQQLVENLEILDVRDLVDKSGNNLDYIKKKVDDGVSLLKTGKKIVVCCDYGMSRSNSIAIGIISRFYNKSFSDAARMVISIVDETGIKIEMLNTVYAALHIEKIKFNNTKRILLTGGSGFLGKATTKTLSKEFDVIAPSSKELNLLDASIEADLFIKEKNIDTVLHLANPKIFTTNISLGETLIMLKNILDICRTNNLRFIYLSGWEIFSGYSSKGLNATEELMPFPKGTYGETKWFAELMINNYVQNYDLNAVIIRSGPVYGTNGDKPKFIYNFLDKALGGKAITTHKYKNGFPCLDLLFSGDLVNLILLVCKSSTKGVIHAGTGKLTSTYDVAHKIKQLVNSTSEITYVEMNDDAPNIMMDCSRAEKLFKWEPTVELNEGLSLIINHFLKTTHE